MQISPLICPHTPKALPPLLNPLVLPQHENPLMERYKFRSGLLLPTTISDDPGGDGSAERVGGAGRIRTDE